MSAEATQRTRPDSNVTRLQDARGRARRRPRRQARGRDGVDGSPVGGETGYEFMLDLASSVNLPDEPGRLTADGVLARLDTMASYHGSVAEDSEGHGGGPWADIGGVVDPADSILAAIFTNHLRARLVDDPREPRGSAA